MTLKINDQTVKVFQNPQQVKLFPLSPDSSCSLLKIRAKSLFLQKWPVYKLIKQTKSYKPKFPFWLKSSSSVLNPSPIRSLIGVAPHTSLSQQLCALTNKEAISEQFYEPFNYPAKGLRQSEEILTNYLINYKETFMPWFCRSYCKFFHFYSPLILSNARRACLNLVSSYT